MRLREGLAQWRRLGWRRGTLAAVRLALRPVTASARQRWLQRRPLSVSRAELERSLAGQPTPILRGTVLRALPTVARFEHDLDRLESSDRSSLVARAELIAAHKFDLLGSGLMDLGPEIDWLSDFKARRRWPLEHISKLPIVLGDGSDIKVPWELSRFQHLPLLAAAHRITGDRQWVREIGAQIESWIVCNPVEFGPNWACTMDVAIRAANWTATLAMVADVAMTEVWFDRALRSLLLHGRFIRSHLEWSEIRSNHYLSDIAGLLSVAAVFCRSDEGQQWARFATAELANELRHQVRDDGCDHEASIPYHRLVAELFICGTQAAQELAPTLLPEDHHKRLERMLTFTCDYTRPDELAPQVGDADDGRFLPLRDYGADPRSHLHLFVQADRPYKAAQHHAAYPEGGYWVMRASDLFVIVRCGDVGVGGHGSHAHNDALSFELALGEQAVVVDPGSYLYTADPVERNRFRSTAFHSTLQIDRVEQNPLRDDALFAMEDRRRAEALSWSADTARPCFVGRHHGYEELPQPATHTRRLELDAAASTLFISDRIDSSGSHVLEWTFPLAPCTADAKGSTAVARFAGGIQVEIEARGIELYVADGWLSPSYGRREPVPFVRGRKRAAAGTDVTEIELRLS